MAVQQTKSRTLYYRRCVWIQKKERTLEKLLISAHRKLRTTGSRAFPHSDGDMQCLRVQNRRGGGLQFHIATYTPHQPASLIPFPDRKPEHDTGIIPPPADHNFMHGDIFVFVCGNDLVLTAYNLREGVAIDYFAHALRKAGMEDVIIDYEIVPVADVSKVKLLHREGVKNLNLKATLYEASSDYIERTTVKRTILNSLSEELAALFAKDDDQSLREIQEGENLSVSVSLSFDSRKRGGELGMKRLSSIASDVVRSADDDGFSITTMRGTKLSSSEVRLSAEVDITRNGESILRSDAWSKLTAWYDELKASGTLQK